jgi:competence protein ComEC
MKFPFLFVSLCCLSIFYIRNLWVNILLIVIYICFYVRHFLRFRVWFAAALLFSCSTVMTQQKPVVPLQKVVVIKEIRAAYCIGEIEDQKVALYGLEHVNYDDLVEVSGNYKEIDGLHNEGEFHFPTWMRRRGIYYAMDVEEYTILEEGETLRHYVYAHIDDMKEEVAGWLRMTLFNIRQEEDVMFMAASSGMHIAWAVAVIGSISALFLSSSAVSMIRILLLCILGLSTAFTFTVFRILCFQMIRFCIPSLSKKDQLGLFILITIIVCPYAVYDIGFVLPVLFRIAYAFDMQKRGRFLLSFLLLIPVQFFYYQYVDPLQILLFPFFRIFYGVCYIAAWIFVLLPMFTFLLPAVIHLQKELFAYMQFAPKFYYLPNILWLSLWMLCALSYMEMKKRSSLGKLMLLLLYTQYASYFNPFLRVMMIDVGQGDCTLFILPYHQGVMLLDVAGNHYKNIPQDILVPMLLKRGVHFVDKAVITHDDFDHSGGLAQLLEMMPVKEVIDKKQKEIELGPIRFSSPLYDHDYESSNDNSILLSLHIYDYHLLFMGDCSSRCEDDLLKEYPKMKADLLKVGHHGSHSSSSSSFLHQLDPLISLISSGRNNRYGHPSKEVLDIMKKEEIYYLNTAEHGSCTFYFSKFFSFYKTADGEFGIIKHR